MFSKSLAKAIQGEFSGNLKNALLALLSPEPFEWYAARLKSAFKGLGTSDRPVCRILGAHDKADAAAIAAAYEAKYGKPLSVSIASECSGNYKRLAIAWFDSADELEQPGDAIELPPEMEPEEEKPRTRRSRERHLV